MRKIQRLAAVGAMAALTVTLAACGGGQPSSSGGGESSAPSAAPAPAPTSTSAAGEGVTTNADVFGPACSGLPQGDEPGSLNNMGPQPVASAASTNPLLTTLVKAVKAANLVDTLNSAPSLTVYAPADSAFQKVPADKLNALLADQAMLKNVLTYHVSGTRYDKDSLLKAGQTMQLNGGAVMVGGSGDMVTLTDGSGATANVVCGNIPTKNATVFVIDTVLTPKA